MRWMAPPDLHRDSRYLIAARIGFHEYLILISWAAVSFDQCEKLFLKWWSLHDWGDLPDTPKYHCLQLDGFPELL
jgi:hypothetical protein